MILFETLLQNAGFTTGTVFALAVSASTRLPLQAYKAFVARPLDPSTLVNFAMRLHSGTTNARFSYPDYERYRDHLHSFTGVIAFSIDQLRLAAGGSANWRRAEAGSWLGRLGLLPATAKGSS